MAAEEGALSSTNHSEFCLPKLTLSPPLDSSRSSSTNMLASAQQLAGALQPTVCNRRQSDSAKDDESKMMRIGSNLELSGANRFLIMLITPNIIVSYRGNLLAPIQLFTPYLTNIKKNRALKGPLYFYLYRLI